MQYNFKNLPINILPYTDIDTCKAMMLKLYEQVPFLPELPNIEQEDTALQRTTNKIQGLRFDKKKLIIADYNDTKFINALKKFDKVYNSEDNTLTDEFDFQSPYFEMYGLTLKRIKPKFTVIKLYGPFSLADIIFNQNTVTLLTNKQYRKFIIEAIGIKAKWCIKTVKDYSPDTKTIILFDEPRFMNYGILKNKSGLTQEDVVSLFEHVYKYIHDLGGIVGVHSSGKCNWKLPIEAGCDIISFDAYKNPNNLSIIAPTVNNFLRRGGHINFSIVPSINENVIKLTNISILSENFKQITDDLILKGVPSDLLYKYSTISPQDNLNKLPILFAEKALILANQLSTKVLQH